MNAIGFSLPELEMVVLRGKKLGRPKLSVSLITWMYNFYFFYGLT